jgi:hypothetical protein
MGAEPTEGRPPERLTTDNLIVFRYPDGSTGA